jgi:NAD(P)-dependent dehydrogenase (short-subunit alcohol dehydrogenase family)
MLCGRDLAPLEKASERVRNLGRRAFVTSCDVCKPAEVDAMVTHTLRMLGGRIDILVNAAGGTGPVERSTIDTTPDEFNDVVAVNMRGVYLTIRAVLPTMMAQHYGKIINVGGLGACAAGRSAWLIAPQNGVFEASPKAWHSRRAHTTSTSTTSVPASSKDRASTTPSGSSHSALEKLSIKCERNRRTNTHCDVFPRHRTLPK